MLDAGPTAVRSRAQDARRGAVAVYIDKTSGAADAAKFERRFGRADGVWRATNRPPRSPPDLRSGPFAVHVADGCPP